MDHEVKGAIARQIPYLRRYAYALTGDLAQADDLVQDCLERAIRKSRLWHRRGSIRGWLFRVLYHVFLNDRRRTSEKHRSVPIEDLDRYESLPAGQESEAVCSDIRTAVLNLPEHQRAVVLLVALEGFSYDEAADILDLPIGTVRSRLARARESLDAWRPRITRPPVRLRRVK